MEKIIKIFGGFWKIHEIKKSVKKKKLLIYVASLKKMRGNLRRINEKAKNIKSKSKKGINLGKSLYL